MTIPQAPEGGGPSARSHAVFVYVTSRSASAWAARVRGLTFGRPCRRYLGLAPDETSSSASPNDPRLSRASLHTVDFGLEFDME